MPVDTHPVADARRSERDDTAAPTITGSMSQRPEDAVDEPSVVAGTLAAAAGNEETSPASATVGDHRLRVDLPGFRGSLDELLPFPPIVRAGFFDVDVLTGLAAPNGHQRMPVIGSGDGDGVNRFVVEELANVSVGFGLGEALFLDLLQSLIEYGGIDVAERGDLCVWIPRQLLDVVIASAMQANDGDLHAVVGTEDALWRGDKGDSAERGQTCSGLCALLEEIATSDS